MAWLKIRFAVHCIGQNGLLWWAKGMKRSQVVKEDRTAQVAGSVMM
jgi:hypothetical protein